MRWSSNHQDLLDALVAERTLPLLCRRLSRERVTISREQARKWRDWARSLSADPGWQAVGPMVDHPDAWPAIWQTTASSGWSARTDHHNALFFMRVCTQCLADQDYEVAHYAVEEALAAWRRVLITPYMSELVDDLAANAMTVSETSSAQARSVATHLLDEFIDARADELRRALGLDNREGVSPLDARAARFAWRALATAIRISAEAAQGKEPDALATLAQVHAQAKRARASVSLGVLTQFQTLVDAIDFSSATAAEIRVPFEWFGHVFALIDYDDDALTTVVAAAVEIGWKLRSLKRDKDPDDFAGVLAAVSPFNDALFERLMASHAFGHNSKCADLLVFAGEKQSSPEQRWERFERALQVCPGHRNASMLASYAYLERANLLLLSTAAVPGFAVHLPGAERRRATVLKARDLFLQAEKLYPTNENIAKYREDVLKECERFAIPFDVTMPEEPSDER
ncbi:MAG: hypothetical protein H0U74_14530 [Bradymonadaceae bacterium]|nr:hypothetical protein [Lujinxingiaceae bacterium]